MTLLLHTSTFFQIRSKQIQCSLLSLTQRHGPIAPYIGFLLGRGIWRFFRVVLPLFGSRRLLFGGAVGRGIPRHRFGSHPTEDGIDLREEPNNFIKMSLCCRCMFPFPKIMQNDGNNKSGLVTNVSIETMMHYAYKK